MNPRLPAPGNYERNIPPFRQRGSKDGRMAKDRNRLIRGPSGLSTADLTFARALAPGELIVPDVVGGGGGGGGFDGEFPAPNSTIPPVTPVPTTEDYFAVTGSGPFSLYRMSAANHSPTLVESGGISQVGRGGLTVEFGKLWLSGDSGSNANLRVYDYSTNALLHNGLGGMRALGPNEGLQAEYNGKFWSAGGAEAAVYNPDTYVRENLIGGMVAGEAAWSPVTFDNMGVQNINVDGDAEEYLFRRNRPILPGSFQQLVSFQAPNVDPHPDVHPDRAFDFLTFDRPFVDPDENYWVTMRYSARNAAGTFTGHSDVLKFNGTTGEVIGALNYGPYGSLATTVGPAPRATGSDRFYCLAAGAHVDNEVGRLAVIAYGYDGTPLWAQDRLSSFGGQSVSAIPAERLTVLANDDVVIWQQNPPLAQVLDAEDGTVNAVLQIPGGDFRAFSYHGHR